MRLTESPRTLAEMRPEVAWSSEVQAALDKALQRDVNARYRTASELGREVSAALEQMAAGAPAVAVGGVPPIRPDTADRPHVTLPVTRVAPDRPASAPSQPPPVRRRRYAAGYASGGVALLVVLIGTAMVMNRPAPREAGHDSVTPSGRPTSDVRTLDTTRSRQPMNSARLSGAGTGGAARTSPATMASPAVGAALDSLEKVVSGDVSPNEATRVVSALEQMKDRVTGNEQVVQAAIVEALAESSRSNKAAACAALRRVQPIAPTTTRAKMVSFTVSQSC